MKKILLILSSVIIGIGATAQNGLDSILVEKYYVSDENDSTGSSGILPVNSVTYRFYADMDSGYNLQVLYGSPTHLLKFTTTTSFFNNTDYGNVFPVFTSGNAKKNTVMLDSWLTMGAACSGYWGVVKTEDDGLNNFENRDDLLLNNHSLSGIPLTEQDGMLAGSPPAASTIGDFSTDVFNDGLSDGDSLGIMDGSWYFLGGVTGPTPNNRVLFAQVTTNGTLHYEINLQVGKKLSELESLTEQYVAHDPDALKQEISGEKYRLSGTLIPPARIIDRIENSSSFTTSVLTFPNPANDFIILEIRSLMRLSNANYRIFNMNGQLVYAKTIGNVSGRYTENISVSGMNNGVYTLLLNADGISRISRFVKK